MTAISDFCTTIRGWLNFEYDDVLITSWVRMAEELLSETLRCKHMVQIDTGEVVTGRVLLPSDWLDLDFVRVVDGGPLRFRSRDEFYNNREEDTNYNHGYYTITGNYLIVGDLDDGVEVELAYYQTIPPLDATNWLLTYYSRLYITATLSVGAMYSFDDARGPVWQTAMQTFVDTINENHVKSRASGSVLIQRRGKGFG